MKKIVSFALATALVAATAATAACSTGSKMVNDGNGVTIATNVHATQDYSYLEGKDFSDKTLKVGAIWVGDRTEGYTRAHDDGIKAAKATIEEATGATVNITYKLSVGEDSTCNTELNTFGQQNFDLVFTNSYGHQFQYGEGADAVWTKYPNTTYVALTGDLAAGVGVDNYKNAFTSVYQSRYVSGVVAGLKLKQLVDDNLLSSKNFDGDNIKIGYVGAYPYAEVVSGYTAFYLGLKSVVSNIVMSVQYTNSWYDFDAEKTTAEALIAQGCVIIGQHADSEGAPTACETAYKKGTRVYSVGYNVDMLAAAPHAALTSATNVWEVYYTYALYTALNSSAKDITTNWTAGYDEGAVDITAINGKVLKTDISAQVKQTADAVKNGDIKVFNANSFTVNGAHLTSYTNSYGMGGAECMVTEGDVTYFSESVIRSAPYFDIRIDGITESGAN
jgi:basic membrane protein A